MIGVTGPDELPFDQDRAGRYLLRQKNQQHGGDMYLDMGHLTVRLLRAYSIAPIDDVLRVSA